MTDRYQLVLSGRMLVACAPVGDRDWLDRQASSWLAASRGIGGSMPLRLAPGVLLSEWRGPEARRRGCVVVYEGDDGGTLMDDRGRIGAWTAIRLPTDPPISLVPYRHGID